MWSPLGKDRTGVEEGNSKSWVVLLYSSCSTFFDYRKKKQWVSANTVYGWWSWKIIDTYTIYIIMSIFFRNEAYRNKIVLLITILTQFKAHETVLFHKLCLLCLYSTSTQAEIVYDIFKVPTYFWIFSYCMSSTFYDLSQRLLDYIEKSTIHLL